MHRLTDSEAIATWERDEAPDPNAGGSGHAYRCTACDWTGRGEAGLKHYRATGHAIRGRNWPASWPNAQFSTPPLLVLCAWCETSAQRTADAALAGRQVTHGICDVHRAEFEAGR